MKKFILMAAAVSLYHSGYAQKAKSKKTLNSDPAPVAAQAGPESKVDKLSYAIGVNFARQFKSQNIEINPDMLHKAIKAIMTGQTALMTDEQVMNTLQDFEKEMQDKMKGEMKKAAEENINKGKAWLAENKKRQGVVELPSGLQYEVIKDGSGESPKATSTVTTHYAGTLVDGTEFDSSIKRGEPATFAVNGVIRGWTEALQLMKPGAKWKLYVPADLAYGDAGSPPTIGPGETLIFEVELISVKN
jgi:FKBP-type peptidyl-prolyl cis-trans isomerase FklB